MRALGFMVQPNHTVLYLILPPYLGFLKLLQSIFECVFKDGAGSKMVTS